MQLRSVTDEQRLRGDKATQPEGRQHLRLSGGVARSSQVTFEHARRSRLAIQPNAFSRDMSEYFNRLLR